jgi:hypothetical protein
VTLRRCGAVRWQDHNSAKPCRWPYAVARASLLTPNTPHDCPRYVLSASLSAPLLEHHSQHDTDQMAVKRSTLADCAGQTEQFHRLQHVWACPPHGPLTTSRQCRESKREPHLICVCLLCSIFRPWSDCGTAGRRGLWCQRTALWLVHLCHAYCVPPSLVLLLDLCACRLCADERMGRRCRVACPQAVIVAAQSLRI